LPDFSCCRVLHKFLVTGICFASYGVHHWVCIVLEIRRYLVDVVLLECGRNELRFDFHLLLDCEGVYRLLCDESMLGSRW
jgi:hypothetical protein